MSNLPPLNPLRAFEAAGRLNSITKAADELCVTPGAVSRQVHELERFLGVTLFRREARAVGLTAQGEAYFVEITAHFSGIRDASVKLTGDRGPEVLRIRAYTTFAMKWLVPHLSEFQEQNSSTEVRLTTSLHAVDFEKENVDCAIRLGDGNWPDLRVDRLVPNHLIPVCSPAYIDQQELNNGADLARVPLLHSLARPDDWMYWLEFAGLKDIDARKGMKYESSVLSYQAAIDGQGVAIAQRVLVTEELRSGRLVQLFGPTLDRGSYTYYLIYPEKSLRKGAFRRFQKWISTKVRSESYEEERSCTR
jgi:LysR family glycine cleavage system transcriptional activator